MTFQRLNQDTTGIKTNAALVQVGNDGTLRVGDYLVEGPGEYDISGVGLHVFPGCALIQSEMIRILAVWDTNASVDNDEETNYDICLFAHESTESMNKVIKDQDPRIVITASELAATALAKEDGVELDQQSSYKVTPLSLPADTRVFVLLV